MIPLLEDKLLDLLVNVIAIILGGGLIVVFIEWQRHQRELRSWKREDELIEIDIPRSDMSVFNWQISEKTSDKEKVMIYENRLENTVHRVTVHAEFVIRNTTSTEIIVTSYFGDVLQTPSGVDEKRYYDLETYDLISVEDMGIIRLKPYGTIPRAFIMDSTFGKDRILDQAPTTLVVTVETSSGRTIQAKSTLKITPYPLLGISSWGGAFHPSKFVEKREKDEEVPF